MSSCLLPRLLQAAGRGCGGEEDGSEQKDRSDWNEQDTEAGIALMDDQAAQEKAAGDENARAGQAEGRERPRLRRPLGKEIGGYAKRDMDEGQERSVGVSQRPHQAASAVGNVKVESRFESMQALKDQAEGQKDEQSPPSEPQMMPGTEGMIEWDLTLRRRRCAAWFHEETGLESSKKFLSNFRPAPWLFSG